MKPCPYCAEEIQDAAIKCRYCGEFTEASGLRGDRQVLPWYFRKSMIVFVVCCVGPLALPMIWWRPQTSRTWKLVWTVIILALSYLMYQATVQALQTLSEAYQMFEQL